jgi:hypothetical protein
VGSISISHGNGLYALGSIKGIENLVWPNEQTKQFNIWCNIWMHHEFINISTWNCQPTFAIGESETGCRKSTWPPARSQSPQIQ